MKPQLDEEKFNPFYLLSKEHLEGVGNAYPNHIDVADLLGHIKQQELLIEAMQQALEWYADEGNYEDSSWIEPDPEMSSPEIANDMGKRARQTLQQVKGDT